VQQIRPLADEIAPLGHVYSVCFFERSFIVPDLLLIDARTDDEALAEARTRRPFTTREVWDRHRLVAVIPPADY
jgi:hypothetical protein